MLRTFVFLPALFAVLAAEQLPTAPLQTSTRQPVARDAWLVADAPVRPATRWSLSATAEVPADAVVTAQGHTVRITAATDVTVFRPAWSLVETFAVGASFAAQSTATYGLTTGGANGLVLLVRNDGSFSVQSLSGGRPSGGAWTPVALRTNHDGTPDASRLEVKVRGGEVQFVINGQMVQTAKIAPDDLDGPPGVYVTGGVDVVVAGFTVERPAILERAK